jgi:hypothetical protein
MVKPSDDDLVIDIGSNDGTSLMAYPAKGLHLVGIDPTGEKFKSYYPDHIKLITDFFNTDIIHEYFPGRKATVITSFSMFYDLESPIDFMKNIHSLLSDNGIWVFEQSYLPAMIETNSFDTVCHEHLEFYCLKQIQYMASKVGFQIIDVEFNDINGGSFSVTVRKDNGNKEILPKIQEILQNEINSGYERLDLYNSFANRVNTSKQALISFIKKAKQEGKKVAALGASTKGNVLLQYCNITNDDILCIGEVNKEKFGCFTPGTWIPIVSEEEMLGQEPDYILVLPWHFRPFFTSSQKFTNLNLIYPLPNIEIVN